MGVRREAENVLDNTYCGKTKDASAHFNYSPFEGVARPVSDGDFNNLTSSGISMGKFSSNTPITSSTNVWYFVVTFNHYNTYFYQIAIAFNLLSTPPIYGRVCLNSSWFSWYQLN